MFDLAVDTLSDELLKKYSISGPRYTSYPTAPMWHEGVGTNQYVSTLSATNAPELGSTQPLSLYAHLPFCEHRCLFCACNVIITQQREQTEKYLGYLFQEIDMLAPLVNSNRPVWQSHWGGGTPTYLSCEQIERLFKYQQSKFNFAPDAEIAIEVDPRVTTFEQLELLRDLGFNRISLGVQDFNSQVQEAVERIQPMNKTEAMVKKCRDLGFSGINFDLIYGLPHQTVASFDETLTEVLRLSPDRIALYLFAQVPWVSPHQKRIPDETLPMMAEKFKIFQLAMRRLTAAGYVYIGMDHFAKPEDELAIALNKGTLHRNFMGYTTRAGTEMLSCGVSSISALNGLYAQNHRKLSRYYEKISFGELPIMRGIELTQSDHMRRRIIQDIFCRGQVIYHEIETAYGVEFPFHFADELAQLAEPIKDGLVLVDATGFQLTQLGRVFSRNIAMPFDAYLQAPPTESSSGENKPSERLFSKTL